MKKFICIFLLLALSLSLISCADENERKEKLVEIPDITAYTLIYPETPSSLVTEACLAINTVITEKCGSRLMLESDFVLPGEEVPTSEFEILVGDTNRALSQKAKSLIKMPNDYVILTEGNSIAIVGNTDKSTVEAAQKFAEYINSSDNVLCVPENHVYQYNYPLAEINGKSPSDFDIVANNEFSYLAENIQSAIYEASGYKLNILKTSEKDSSIIIEIDNVKYGNFSIKAEDNDIRISSMFEYGVSYAAEYFISLINSANEKLIVEGEKIMSISEQSGKVYAVDKFYNEDGTLKDASAKLDLNIVYFGGSLTEGGTAWRNMTAQYFEERFGGKVNSVNSGLGGTGTSVGAARFMTDVAKYEPDIIFIDFTLNDGGALPTASDSSKMGQQVYFENIIRQALSLEKVPVIIVLHTPQPADADSEKAIKMVEGGKLKDKVLTHYGIAEGVVVYDQFVKEYEEAKKAEETSDAFFDWLGTSGNYRYEGNGVYNVHPNQEGYAVYGNAVLSAFEEKGLEYFLKPINPKADVYCKSQANVVKATYNLIPATDTERINYSGEWKFYGKYAYDYDTNKDAKSYLGALGTLQGEEYGYGARYSYYLVDGLAQCYKYTNASFELTTKADVIYFFYNAAAAISEIDVSANGKTTKLTFNSKNMPQYFMSSAVNIEKKDSEEAKVSVVVADATDSSYLFRFGYIVECFYGE